MMTMRLNPEQQSEIICYYFNESSEKQIVTINKSPLLPAEVLLQPKQGLFFEAMPDTFVKIYRMIFSGREVVDTIRCKSLRVSTPASTQPIAPDYAIA